MLDEIFLCGLYNVYLKNSIDYIQNVYDGGPVILQTELEHSVPEHYITT